ncbi:unnamed protein product [Dovyalis caffra]|uniref:Late embryogenesis abundant protein LEA-2 subgroup domain-containing protein n=1 Tax=Dovyalis caffra TaxID=77055 RepID=A0AAV1SI12_9ROSI|nr:unnamed protein product [Dovyalis caffra]
MKEWKHYRELLLTWESLLPDRFCWKVSGAFLVVFFLLLRWYDSLLPVIQPQFEITSFSLTNFKISPAHQRLTANWNATFEVHYPNSRFDKIYYEFYPLISYNSDMLTRAPAQVIEQDGMSTTTIDVGLSVVDSFVGEQVVYGINKDRAASGKVGFDLGLKANSVAMMGVFRTDWGLLTLLCRNVEVGLSATSESGNLVGGAKPCELRGHFI